MIKKGISLIFCAVIFINSAQSMQYNPCISKGCKSFIESCRRFSRPFSDTGLTFPQIYRGLGLKPEQVRVIDALSVIIGAFSEDTAKMAKFISLSDKKNIPQLKKEIRKFLDEAEILTDLSEEPYSDLKKEKEETVKEFDEMIRMLTEKIGKLSVEEVNKSLHEDIGESLGEWINEQLPKDIGKLFGELCKKLGEESGSKAAFRALNGSFGKIFTEIFCNKVDASLHDWIDESLFKKVDESLGKDVKEAFKKSLDELLKSIYTPLKKKEISKIPYDRKYIFNSVAKGLEFDKYRKAIVAFLAALDYKKTLDPSFKVYLARGKSISTMTETDRLTFTLEHNDGTHDSDDQNSTFSLPYFKHEKMRAWHDLLVINPDEQLEDAYTYAHEFGHATYDLLGTIVPTVDLTDFFKETSFGEENLDFDDDDSDSDSDAEDTVVSLVRSGYERKSIFRGSLNMMSAEFEEIEELRKTGKNSSVRASVEYMKNTFFPMLLSPKFDLVQRKAGLECWTSFAELWQICGVFSFNGETVVNLMSDLDIRIGAGADFPRWLHMALPKDEEKESSDDSSDDEEDELKLKLAPKNKWMKALLQLHGLN